MTDSQYKKAKKLYLNGVSLMQIGKTLKVNRKVLSLLLRKDGLRTQRNYSDELIQEVTERLEKGELLSRIGKDKHFSSRKMAYFLHQRGIRLMADKGNSNINEELQAKIVSDYNDGLSLREIGEKFNIAFTKIHTILRRNQASTDRDAKRKYKLDETIFDVIDTEERAYWLGFLLADGCVTEEKCLELTLMEADESHIEKFRAFLKTDAPIKRRIVILGEKSYSASRLIIYSKYLVASLISLGCIPCKSLKLKFPKISENLINHFMRGYFDGDGTLHVRPDGQMSFSVIGTKEFLDGYEKRLRALGLNHTKRSFEGRAFTMRYSGNVAVGLIRNYLYKDATVFLERKYTNFHRVTKQVIVCRYSDKLISEIAQRLDNGETLSDISLNKGINKTMLSHELSRRKLRKFRHKTMHNYFGEFAKKVARLFSEGHSIKQLATKYEIGRGSIREMILYNPQ